ncbi:hypothetical protein DLAC_06404 [Tieghemostelium lacteum]|uniref:Transmembrane protein n=1 Tax=Tieghemostelium lacteum TaxID=361077 RepID=A0A151ZEX2_TIELA|nr:hypothetical protein DLAC_06404 [Tieghemostelium lacteum]|eukprot:KYQ92424.1 hypothetical protein DLAC_06404 [Tieghemostelium lacteum]
MKKSSAFTRLKTLRYIKRFEKFTYLTFAIGSIFLFRKLVQDEKSEKDKFLSQYSKSDTDKLNQPPQQQKQ